jgi:hypothetical protein
MRRSVFALSLAAALAGVGAQAAAQTPTQTPAPTHPRPRSSGAQVVLLGDLAVPRGSSVGEVVIIRGDALIEGVAERDVIVVRGSIAVAGQVAGDVVAVSGRVRLGPTAQVGGSVMAGDTVQAEAGAQVAGSVTQGARYSLAPTLRTLGPLLAPAAFVVSVAIVAFSWLLLAPRALEAVAWVARDAPAAATGWGLLTAIVIPALGVVLAGSILGLPVGLAMLLAAGFAWLLGLAATTVAVGRAVVPAPRSRTGAAFAGWAITGAVGLVPLLNVAWWTLGPVFGLGLIVVATWRSRRSGDDPLRARRRGRHRAGRGTGSLGADGADVPAAGLG